MDIFDYIDCVGCGGHRVIRGRTRGDPDSCCPDEAVCTDGDFGSDYPCGRMLSRIEEGLRDGDFYFNLSFLAETEHLTDPAMKEDYEYVFKACPGVAWDAHRYWQVFYDGETAPIGYDTPEAVYEGVF